VEKKRGDQKPSDCRGEGRKTPDEVLNEVKGTKGGKPRRFGRGTCAQLRREHLGIESDLGEKVSGGVESDRTVWKEGSQAVINGVIVKETDDLGEGEVTIFSLSFREGEIESARKQVISQKRGNKREIS